jgi:hypothetical protein
MAADVAQWAEAAWKVAAPLVAAPEARARWLRCEGTWFAGVDLLPNDPDGGIGGVPFPTSLRDALAGLGLPARGVAGAPWHRAQVSVTYPGYPRPRAGESPGAARYRMTRDAAHLDGLLPVGPGRRRHLREPHAFILGLPLTESAPAAAPLVVWEGSHRLLGEALAEAVAEERAATGPRALGEIDLTDAYRAARSTAFTRCRRAPLPVRPGEALVLHRHTLHGIAPWSAPPEAGRAIAYFRPLLVEPDAWLAPT